MANRYSQGANAQFNPLSMQEIARYPELLRQKKMLQWLTLVLFQVK